MSAHSERLGKGIRAREAELDRPLGQPSLLSEQQLHTRIVRFGDPEIADINRLLGESYVRLARGFSIYNAERGHRKHANLLAKVQEDVGNDSLAAEQSGIVFKVSTKERGLIATGRLGIWQKKTEESQYRSETEMLWKPTEGAVWEHEAMGLSDNKAGEVSRIAVDSGIRSTENTPLIIKTLMRSIFDKARELDMKILYITLTTEKLALHDHVERILMEDRDFEMTNVYSMELRENEPEAQRIYHQYFRYWRDGDPRVFVIYL